MSEEIEITEHIITKDAADFLAQIESKSEFKRVTIQMQGRIADNGKAIELLKAEVDFQAARAEKAESQLAKAEKVIEFYAGPETWIKRDQNGWCEHHPKDDKEQIRGYKHPIEENWIGTVTVGGKRARQYFREKGEG